MNENSILKKIPKKLIIGGTLVCGAVVILGVTFALVSHHSYPNKSVNPSGYTGAVNLNANPSNKGNISANSPNTADESKLAQYPVADDDKEQAYAAYVPFGMTFDKNMDMFVYNGHVVRQFYDGKAKTSFSDFRFQGPNVNYGDGVLLIAKYDDNENLAGLELSNTGEFDKVAK